MKSNFSASRIGFGARAMTLAFCLGCCWRIAWSAQQAAAPLSPAEAIKIANDAYIYGYSLITTEVTRVQMSNVSTVEGMHAPMGQFANIKRYPPADFRAVSARPTPTPFTRLPGSTWRSRRSSAIRTWANASICSR